MTGRRNWNACAIALGVSCLAGCAHETPQLPTMYLPLGIVSSSFAESAHYKSELERLAKALDNDSTDISVYRQRARLHVRASQFVQAEVDLTRAIEVLMNDNSPESNVLAGLHIQRGTVRWGLEHVDRAIADYTQAIELKPNAWEAYFHRWQAYRFQGKTDLAEQDRERGMQLNPEVFGKEYAFDFGVI